MTADRYFIWGIEEYGEPTTEEIKGAEGPWVLFDEYKKDMDELAAQKDREIITLEKRIEGLNKSIVTMSMIITERDEEIKRLNLQVSEFIKLAEKEK